MDKACRKIRVIREIRGFPTMRSVGLTTSFVVPITNSYLFFREFMSV